MDDEANALRGNATHAAPGLDSRVWLLPPMVGAEPNPGVITDDWILSQVVFDEDVEAPIPAAVLQIEDRPPLEEAVVPPNQVPSSISPTVPFVAHQIEDQAAHPAAHPEPAQSWSLTWDQFDQLLGSGSQTTPPDFGRLDFDSGVFISVGNLDIQSLFDADWRSQPSRIDRSFDALPTREPIQGFPRGGENDPIEDFSPSQVAGSAQPEAGELAFLLSQVHLMLTSFTITPVRRIWASSLMQYHLTCQVPATGMRTATTLVQIHRSPQVLKIGTRTAITRAQIRQIKHQVSLDRTRAAKQQAQILPPLRREAMPVSSRPSIGIRLGKSPRPTSSTSKNSPATVQAMDPSRMHLVLGLLFSTFSTFPSIRR